MPERVRPGLVECAAPAVGVKLPCVRRESPCLVQSTTRVLCPRAGRCRVDGSGGHVASQAPLHFVENGPSVGVLAQADERQQRGLLERSKEIRH
jgi:hypothetical protein